MSKPTVDVERIVEEFDSKFIIRGKEGRYRVVKLNELMNGDEAVDWLRTTLTTYGHNRYQQGVKDTLAGVPEEMTEGDGWDVAFDEKRCCPGDDIATGHNTCRAAVIKHGEGLLEGK